MLHVDNLVEREVRRMKEDGTDIDEAAEKFATNVMAKMLTTPERARAISQANLIWPEMVIQSVLAHLSRF